MDGSQAIASFAFAAIPGVFVVEVLELGKPRLREREASRALALYLMVSAAVWALAVVVLGADQDLAVIVAPPHLNGAERVATYESLAWRLATTAIVLGVVGRILIWALERTADRLEHLRRTANPSAGGKLGDALIGLASFSFAWDAMVARLRRDGRAQVVQVRLRDGSIVYGVLASAGRADFQADGRGLVLDHELTFVGDRLAAVPGSNGIFFAPEEVATLAIFDFGVLDSGDSVHP